MCFYSKLTKKAVELENRFKATFEQGALFNPSQVIQGFSFPQTPVITNIHPHTIQLFNWGLIPTWAKDRSIQKSTLNARIETLTEKPAFRQSALKRCLVPADGFYEWQWLDPSGKHKQKYLLHKDGDNLFAFGGIYAEWTDPNTGEVLHTYSLVTTEALGIMETVHNSKHRMPVILTPGEEQDWLQGAPLSLFGKTAPDLIATAV